MRVLLLAVLFLVGCGGVANQDDLDELFARTAYLLCVDEAETAIEDSKLGEDEVWREYISENASYAEYEREYDAYARAYSEYLDETERCWDEYQGSEVMPDA